MAYVGVEFDQEERGFVAIVSDKWLTPSKQHTYWPNYTTQYDYDKSLHRGELPVIDKWQHTKLARIFFETDDYNTAQRKIKLAEELSDVATDHEQTTTNKSTTSVCEKSKRKRVAPRRLYDDVDESDCSIEEENILPKPPRISIEGRNNYNSNQILDTNPESLPLRRSSSKTSKSIGSVQSNLSPQHSSTFLRDKELSTPRSTLSSRSCSSASSTITLIEEQQGSSFQSNPSTGKKRRALTDETIIDLFSCIKEQNKQILAWIQKQSNSSSESQINQNQDLPFVLPITKSADLATTETCIKEKEIFNLLVSHLSRLGGKDVTSKTNNMMRQLLSNDLATKYSFMGSRQEKKAFNDLLVKTAVVRAVQRSCTSTVVSDDQVHTAIKIWLKHAPQRLQAELKTKQKKAG
ncbi:uncharacterized protein LOC116181090 isoform X1 [Photinus pyralis]|uniref:uncharacterized protein LOC116181090 isoform X1 n=1 Tax=Photinus pyralis TaxID=7054 RepID=UPI001267004B|nr:uncharacterized protein LOC116181090 isoform X1 [Photinus pyralis]